MNTSKKIIKYLFTALSISLAILIIFLITNVIYNLIEYIQIDNSVVNESYTLFSSSDNKINSVDINIYYNNLIIKEGEYLKIETNNPNIYYELNNDILKIKEENKNGYFNKRVREIIVYLPKEKCLTEFNITLNSGRLIIDNLNSKKSLFTLKNVNPVVEKPWALF